VVVLALGALAVTAIASPLATGSAGNASKAKTDTVYIKYRNDGFPRFFPPRTVRSGDTLRILNKTNPKAIGPHTFALVTRKSFPRTRPQRKKCFTPGHICLSIAGWLGVKGPNGQVTENPGEAGKPGWSTLGNLKRKGDVWFTGGKPGTSFAQKVTINTSKGPRRLFFLCAIHPWMHGSIKVLP
jgi:hypothetical protein